MRKDPYDSHLWLPPQEPKYKSTSGFVQSWFVATSIVKSCAVWVWGGGVLKFKIAVLLVLLLELMVRESSKNCSLGQQLVCGGPLCTLGSKRVVNACFSLTHTNANFPILLLLLQWQGGSSHCWAGSVLTCCLRSLWGRQECWRSTFASEGVEGALPQSLRPFAPQVWCVSLLFTLFFFLHSSAHLF